jgi:hypothetical protein
MTGMAGPPRAAFRAVVERLPDPERRHGLT